MLPAARGTDPFLCNLHAAPPVTAGGNGLIKPRVGATVRIGVGSLPAAREGDPVICAIGGEETILEGEPSVRIEGKPAARLGDPITKKVLPSRPEIPGQAPIPTAQVPIPTGQILLGYPTVRIGSLSQARALRSAAAHGAPFCEECEKARGAGEGKGP